MENQDEDQSSAHQRLRLSMRFNTPRKCRVGINIKVTTHRMSEVDDTMYPYSSPGRLLHLDGKFYIKLHGSYKHDKLIEAFADGMVSSKNRYRSSTLAMSPRKITWEFTK